MDQLTEYFLNTGFPASNARTIVAAFKPQELAKGDYFVQAGRTSRSLAFLVEGLLQFYSTDAAGAERTTYVSRPGTFVASLLSFLNEIPAVENIRAISKASILTLTKEDLLELRNSMFGFKDFYINLLEWQICCIDKSKFDMITLSAEQRYEKIMREEPGLLQEVPLQYIASMLGITPRHLSRLRAKI